MPGDLGDAVQDADVGVGGHQGQGPAHGLGRDGIVVEIEMHVDGLAGAHLLHPIGVEGVERKRQQAGLFFGKSLGHGACAIVGPAALVRDFIAPQKRLAIAIRQGREHAACPERIAYIPDGPFHAALLISRSYLARTWHEVIVSGQFQQPRVEMNLVAAAFQHRAAKIVVQDDSGRAGPVLKGAHVAAQEILRRLVEKELQIQHPRPGQGDDETGELALGAADHDRAKVGPVHLCLLGGKDLQTQEGFARLGAQTCDHTPQLLNAAGVAAIPDHMVEACGAQAGMLLQHLAHKRQVRIDHGRPQRLGVLEAFHFNGAPHGVRVDVQGLCNRADLPMLGKEIAANLYAGFGTDHASSPSSWNLCERIDETAWPATNRAT